MPDSRYPEHGTKSVASRWDFILLCRSRLRSRSGGVMGTDNLKLLQEHRVPSIQHGIGDECRLEMRGPCIERLFAPTAAPPLDEIEAPRRSHSQRKQEVS